MLLERCLPPAALRVAVAVASSQRAPQSRRREAPLVAAPQALGESQETFKAAGGSARGLQGDCSQIFLSLGASSVWQRGPVPHPLCKSSELRCRLLPGRNVMVVVVLLPGVQGQCTGQAARRALAVHLLPALYVCVVDKKYKSEIPNSS